MDKKALLSLALLALLASSGLSFAQALSPDICAEANIITVLEGYWNWKFGNWVDLCAIGILISFFTISILYMVAHAFGKPDLSAWCKSELFQVIVTAIILGGILGFVNFSCSVFKPSLFVQLEAGQPDNLYQYAEEYLEWLKNRTYSVYYVVTVINSVIAGISSVFVNSSPGGFGVAMRPLSGFNSLSSILTFVMNTLLIGAVFPTMAQLRMLHVVNRMMFNILLPIGLMARCFEPTRRFGGSVMAIAIGLFLFYPFLLTLNAGIVRDTTISGVTYEGLAGDLRMKPVIDEANRMFVPSADPLYYGNSLDPTAMKQKNDWAQDPAQANSYNPAGGAGYDELKSYTQYVSAPSSIHGTIYNIALDILIAALFLPLINFLLVVAFILNLSKVLGEEVDVTAITRMI